MNEPKKRGRPTNAEKAAKAVNREDLSGVVEEVSASIPRLSLDDQEVAAAVGALSANRAAQAYADRVWAGQSPDAPRAWRIERVKLALEGQNLPLEGVVLP